MTTLKRALIAVLCLIGLFSFAIPGFSKTSSSTASSSPKIDINSATEAQLEALPGIGAATAEKIIKARPIHSLDDLKAAGISESTAKKIAGEVTFGPSSATTTAKTK